MLVKRNARSGTRAFSADLALAFAGGTGTQAQQADGCALDCSEA